MKSMKALRGFLICVFRGASESRRSAFEGPLEDREEKDDLKTEKEREEEEHDAPIFKSNF